MQTHTTEDAKTASQKKIYYVAIGHVPYSILETMDYSSTAMKSKNLENCRTALQDLNNHSLSKLCNNYEESTQQFMVQTSAGGEPMGKIILALALSPEQVNNFNKNKLKINDITHCYPSIPQCHHIKTILDSNTMGQLRQAIASFHLSGILPPRTPLTVKQPLDQLKNNHLEPFQNMIPSDNKEEQKTLDTMISELSKTFILVKQKIQEYLATKALSQKRRKTFLDYIRHIEDIETVLQEKLNALKTTATLKTTPFVPPKFPEEKPRAEIKFTSNPVETFIACGLIEDEQDVDLKIMPVSHGIPLSADDNLTLGDLHGNAIKLIHFLIHENVIQGLNDNDYQELVSIYKKPVNALNKTDLNKFDALLQKITAVNPNSPLITFIGDVLADRGSNDYFTLKVLERLKEIKVPFDIMISNHDRAFLKAYESGELDEVETNEIHRLLENAKSNTSHTYSLSNLQELIDKGLIEIDPLLTMIEQVYLPSLRALRLPLDEKEKKLNYCTHATVRVKHILRLAKQFSLPITEKDLKTHIGIKKAVNDINEVFCQLVNERKVYESSPEGSALYDLMWERLTWDDKRYDWNDSRNDDILPEKWSVNYIHGHDGCGMTPSLRNEKNKVFNLDNNLGKDSEMRKSKYTAFYMGSNPNFLKLRAEALKAKSIINQKNVSNENKEIMTKQSNQALTLPTQPTIWAGKISATQEVKITDCLVTIKKALQSLDELIKKKIVEASPNTIKQIMQDNLNNNNFKNIPLKKIAEEKILKDLAKSMAIHTLLNKMDADGDSKKNFGEQYTEFKQLLTSQNIVQAPAKPSLWKSFASKYLPQHLTLRGIIERENGYRLKLFDDFLSKTASVNNLQGLDSTQSMMYIDSLIEKCDRVLGIITMNNTVKRCEKVENGPH